MATRAGGAYIEIRADNKKLKGDLDKSHKMVSGSTNKMQSHVTKALMGVKLAAAATAVAFGAVIIKASMLGASFEKSMKTVQAVSGATGAELDKLTKIAREMGSQTEFSASQAAESLKFLSMAGLSVKQSMEALPGMLDLATAAQMDLGLASDIVTDTLSAFGMKTKELTRLSDAFIATAQKSNTSVQMLGESFKFVAPVAAQMGYSVEQTAGYLGVLANSGIKASMAGTDLRSIMLGTGKAAKKLGIEGASLNTVLKTIHDRQLSANEVMDLFNKISVKSALVLSSQTGAAEKLTQTIHDMAGVTSKTAQIMRDGLSADMATLKSTAEEASLKMFELFGPELREAVQNLTTIIRESDLVLKALGKTADVIFKTLNTVMNVLRVFAKGVKDVNLATLEKIKADKVYYEIMGKNTDQLDAQIAVLEKDIKSAQDAKDIHDLLTATFTNQIEALKGVNTEVDNNDEKLKNVIVTLTEIERELRDDSLSKALDQYFGEIETHVSDADKLHNEMIKTWEEGELKKVEAGIEAHEKGIEETEKALQAQTDATQKALEEQQEAYKHMGDNIHDVFSTLYKGLLDGQTDVFDQILASFKSMIAEMMAQASKDLVMNLIFGTSGSSGGGTGLMGKLSSMIFGGGSGGGSVGGFNLSNLGKIFGMGGGVPAGSFGPALGIPGSMAMAGNSAYTLGIGGGGLSGTLGGGGMSAGASWPSMLTGAAGIGVIAAAGMIATKVLGRMFSEKPQFGISGMAKEAWKFGTGSFDREINPYEIAMENMYDDFKSNLYDYRVFAADFDNEPEMRNTLFTYFDTVFANVDKAMSTNINDVLKDYQHLGVSFRLTEDMNAEQALKGLSSAVFSELLGSMLLGVLPGQGNMDQIVSTIVGSKRITAGDLAAKNAPKPGSREFYDSSGFSVQGKGSGADTYLYSEPVYEDIIHQVSAVADIFNTAFFEAIMPEGSTTWDAFISFSDTVKKTTDFMEKFDNRVNNLGLSSVEAYNQIAFVSNALAELDAAVENMNLNVMQVTIKTLVEGFNALNDELKTANATTEELTEAQELQNSIFAGTVKEMAAPTAAIFQQMADSVKNFVFNADQLKMQQIAGQGEKINKFFTELYDAAVLAGDPTYIAQLKEVQKGFGYVVNTLAMVEGLNLYKSQLLTVGAAKAGIAGLSNEFTSATIGQKYGVQLDSTQQQANFVKKFMGWSPSEFIESAGIFNVSVEEMASDMTTMANIVKGTSDVFLSIQKTIKSTIISLEDQFGTSGNSTLSAIMKDFNKAAGDAMSLDPTTAAAGAGKLADLSGKAMKKALETAKNSYEYNKIWSKVLGTLKDVESSTSQTVTALEVVDPQAQLTELKTIALDTGKIDTGIAALLNEQTFIDYYSAFNDAFNDGLVFDNLNSTLLKLPDALGIAFGDISINASAALNQALIDIVAAMGLPNTTIPNISSVNAGKVPTTTTPSAGGAYIAGTSTAAGSMELTGLISKYGLSGATSNEISAAINSFNSMSAGGPDQVAWANSLGVWVGDLQQDVKKMQGYGYKEGGIATGPKSGYSALLHGTEAIIPMGKGNIPLTLQNDYSEGILLEIKGLRTELRNVNAVNSLKIKKIKQTLDRVSDGGTTFAVETK